MNESRGPHGASRGTSPAPLPTSATVPAASSFAVIIPAFDEAANMSDLFAELSETFRNHELDGEVVLVDDGSSDGTLAAAREAAAREGFARLRLLRHRTNRGKTSALVTGARATDAEVLVLYDADLQHSTEEIPRFLEGIEGGLDVVTGRKVGQYDKRFVSSVYNGLARRLFDVPVRDMNSMKAFRREVLEDLHLREDWHRYLVVLANARGWKIGEIDIELLPRRHGDPKYGGSGRILVGMLDLLAVWFQLVFSRKPLMFFGVTGLALLAAGGVVGLIALWLRFVEGSGFRPLLNLVLLLVLLGGLLFIAGLIGELIAGLRSEVDDLRRELRRADRS
ncbi:MAG: glycosyltransferase family 2 protein [marine benthic group bacterium]|nr:glycosyltransferase family 2 protein [Gemmatimonadota bacterium]MCL7961729.1 glycosyltransferase family 2 protein [Candidatus Carthagonibacter metallireducens]MCL7973664.1 glycosyltransferase family 2 protein [Gemmatimonadota bacterium]MCL7984997.1 glycosyltransferase family 2 protein [Gemmatimonadota bacterium]MCL7990018.1 glycosyltransferase family 2 protein [Gemmatimonadota bacterium]